MFGGIPPIDLEGKCSLIATDGERKGRRLKTSDALVSAIQTESNIH